MSMLMLLPRIGALGLRVRLCLLYTSILPVSGWKYQEMSYLTNENIDHYNRLLKEYSEENGYIFFDISSEFKDEEGNLAREFDAGDGLHFNQNFYQRYICLLYTSRCV